MQRGHALFPHKQENFVVLVPNDHRPISEVWHIFATSPIFSVWCIAITLFSAMRCWLRYLAGRRSNEHNIPVEQITFETCGLSFGWAIASKATVRRPERVLLVFVSLFAILSGIICSGMLLQQFTFNRVVSMINTFKDLQQMQMMTILIPLGLEFNQDIWNPNQ